MLRFTTDPYSELSGVPVSELPSRTFAAAKLSMLSASYSHEDRLECSALILSRLMADAEEHRKGLPAKHGRPADVLRFIRRAELLSGEPTVPRELATFSRMSGLAANYRRGLDRLRLAEERARATSKADTDFRPRSAEDITTDLATLSPDAAHSAARDALASLGLPRLGKAYPLAYAAVRGTGERDALAELGIGSHALTDGAARTACSKALSRARKAVPSSLRWGMDVHLDSVGLLDSEGVSMKPSRSRNTSADLENRERTSQRHMDSACVVSSSDPCPSTERADWAKDLAPATVARYERATELKRARANATDAAERTALDAERGADYDVVSR